MTRHPIEEAMKTMSKRDLSIAEMLCEECGEGNEGLYAMLDTPNTMKLLERKAKPLKAKELLK